MVLPWIWGKQCSLVSYYFAFQKVKKSFYCHLQHIHSLPSTFLPIYVWTKSFHSQLSLHNYCFQLFSSMNKFFVWRNNINGRTVSINTNCYLIYSYEWSLLWVHRPFPLWVVQVSITRKVLISLYLWISRQY